VDHTAVVAALVQRELAFLLEDGDANPRLTSLESSGSREADEARADYGDIDRSWLARLSRLPSRYVQRGPVMTVDWPAVDAPVAA